MSTLTEDDKIRYLVYDNLRKTNDKDEWLIEVIKELLKLRNNR